MKSFITAILAASLLPTAVEAGACGDEVTQFEQKVRQEERKPSAGATARQTTAAQLHRQPTPQSVTRSEDSAQAAFVAVVARARAADAAGNESACRKALGEAKDMFDPM